MRWILAVIGVCVFGVIASANDREIDAGRRKLEELRQKIERLEDAGKSEAAEELRMKARQLAERLEHAAKNAKRSKKTRKKTRRGGTEELVSVLEGLEHGIAALKKIGKKEEVAHLHRIANGVRERIQHAKGADKERRAAHHHLEILELAFRAYGEAKQERHRELCEHAIHARELRLKGRRDEEAQEVMNSAPSRETEAELLMGAARLYRGWKRADSAERCEELANLLLRRRKGGHSQERMARIEERVERMERVLEEMMEMLRKRDRRRDR
ncbi:MAG: hypothetical protein V3T86_01140 [Planctomycetota bacterium]